MGSRWHDEARATLAPYLSEARRRRIAQVLDHRTRSVTVVLEDLVSDHNGAAVLRTADALGLMEVHAVSPADGFPLSRKVALGTEKWVELVRHRGIDLAYASLRARGFSLWAAAVHGDAVAPSSIPMDRPVALVLGNEHAGLSEAAAAEADGLFRLPMYGFVESFNVSVAAALALSGVLEARRSAGTLPGLDPEDRAAVETRWFMRSVRAAPMLLAQAGLPAKGEP